MNPPDQNDVSTALTLLRDSLTLGGISESQSTSTGAGPSRIYSMHRRLLQEASRLGENLPEAVPDEVRALVASLRSHARIEAEEIA